MFILLIYVALGSFLDVLIVIILTTPIIYPTIVGLGYDPIWWGVMVVRIMEVGMISPPFGINLFVLAQTIKVPLGTVLPRGIAVRGGRYSASCPAGGDSGNFPVPGTFQ
jgi:TRAP-type C4-dicarboxylate transport system permease large subunit